MSKLNDGGPAFPTHDADPGTDPRSQILTGGMSLRDRIALEALGGMLAHSTRYKPRPGSSANWHEAISEEAYEIADAMILARSKGEA